MRKNDIISFLLTLSVLIFLCFISYHYAESDDEKIRRYLIEQGYEVEHIAFTRTDFMRRLYQASEPIDIGNGEPVEYWEVRYWGRFSMSYQILPYPGREFPEMVSIELKFTPNEYEVLKHRADDQPIDEYLKSLILNADEQ